MATTTLTAAQIQALSAGQIATLAASGTTVLAASDASVTLTAAQVVALENAAVTVTVPTGNTVTVADLATQVQALTSSQLGGLAGIGARSIAATDTPAVYTVPQVQALANAGVSIIAPAGSAQNDGTAVVTPQNAGGITFDITWDSSVASAPAQYKADVLAAFQFYADTFSAPVTLYYNVGFGERADGALPGSELGESTSEQIPTTYAALLALFNANATSSVQKQAYATLPPTDPTSGLNFYAAPALLETEGDASVTSSAANPDGSIGFSSTQLFDYSSNPDQTPSADATDFLGVVEHEISEVMGRVSIDGSAPNGVGKPSGNASPIDLFRYTASGMLAISPLTNPSYFSVDGGVTQLAPFNNYTAGDTGDPADWLNTDPYTPNSYNDGSGAGVVNPVNAADVAVMNVLGYETTTPSATPSLPPLVDLLFFDGLNVAGQQVLWVSQGGAGSTRQLVGVSGIAGDEVDASDITAAGTKVLFSGTDLHGNSGLWVSDGTAAGTELLTGVVGAPAGGWQASNIVALGGQAVFSAADAEGNIDLWISDGTAAGTRVLATAASLGGGRSINSLTVVGTQLVFNVSNSGGQGNLWVSDGTTSGTHLLVADNEGGHFTQAGGQFFFSDDAGALWVSDGTLGGTHLVESSVVPVAMAAFQGGGYQGSIVYSGVDANNNWGIWISDGTAAGTKELTGRVAVTSDSQNAIRLGGSLFAYSNPYYSVGGVLAPINIIYFQGSPYPISPVYQQDTLYQADGTPNGTVPTSNFVGEGPFNPLYMFPFDGFEFIYGQSFAPGFPGGLWMSDGVTVENITSYITGASSSGLEPTDPTVFNGNLYFNGIDAAGNPGLWEIPAAGINQQTITGLGIPVLYSGELSGISGASAGGIDPTDLTSLYVAGPTPIAITVGKLLLDLVSPGIQAAPVGSAYVVTDTAFDIESLTPAEILAGKALGVGAASSIDGSLVFNVAQAIALEDPVAVQVPPGATASVADFAQAIEAMTPDQMSGLAAIGIGAIVATDASVELLPLQEKALAGAGITISAPAGDTVATGFTQTMTAAAIEALNAAQISAIGADGYTGLAASDASVGLTVAQALAAEAAGLAVSAPAGDKVTLTDSAPQISALTPATIAALPAAGFAGVVVNSGSVSLTLAQVLALDAASLTLALPAGQLVIADSAANFAALTTGQIATLKSAGQKTLDAGDAGLMLSAGIATTLAQDGFTLTVPGGDELGVSGTAEVIAALTPAQITAMALLGVSVLAPNSPVTIGIAQAKALEGGLMRIAVPPGYGRAASISDVASAIEGLNTTQIAALSSAGVTPAPGYPAAFASLAASDGDVTLSLAQALAFAASSYALTVPYGASMTVTCTAAALQSLTLSQIGQLSDFGAEIIAVSDTSAQLSLAQAQAILANGMSLSVPGGDIAILDTAAHIAAMTPSAFTQFDTTGLLIRSIVVTDTGLSLTVDQATALQGYLWITVPTGQSVSIVDTAANLQNLLAGPVLRNVAVFTGAARFIATDGAMTLNANEALALQIDGTNGPLPVQAPVGDKVTLVDTAANIQALSSDYMRGLNVIGVSAIIVSDQSLTLTVAQAIALLDPVSITVPAGASVSIVDSESNLDLLTQAQVAALGSIGITQISATGLTGAGTLSVAGGVTLSVAGVVLDSQSFAFGPGGGTLQIADAMDMSGTIDALAPLDTIDLSGAAFDPSISLDLSAGNVLAVNELSGSWALTLDPAQVLPNPAFSVRADTGGGTELSLVAAPLTSYLAIWSGQYVEAPTLDSGGVLDVMGGGTLASATITNSGEVVLEQDATAEGAVDFATPGGTLVIEDTMMPSVIIADFAVNDTVDLANISFDPLATVTPVAGNGAEIVTNGQAYDLQFDAAVAAKGLTYVLAPDGGEGTSLQVIEAACYLPGTLIATDHGEVPIENLLETDRVLTVFGDYRPIVWVGKRSYAGRFIRGNRRVLPITIRAGALAEGVPARNLTVSPLHAMFLEDVLIDAQHLVNGVTITQAEAVDEVTYYNIELDTHDVIFAEGASAETFVGDESRALFQNSAEYDALYPGAVWQETRYYAPRLDSGAAVHRAKNNIARRAGLAEERIATAPGMFHGFLDRVDDSLAEGWAQDMTAPEDRVEVEILLDGRSIGAVLANGLRADLREAFGGSGRHGFTFHAPEGLSLGAGRLTARCRHGSAPLPRSGGLGLAA